MGRDSYFSPEGKIALMVLKSYTCLSDRDLIAQLNANLHYQIFCGVVISPLNPSGIINLIYKCHPYSINVCLSSKKCCNNKARVSAVKKGIRIPQSIDKHQTLFRKQTTHLAADRIYATNYNRKYCSDPNRKITTSFIRKGRESKHETQAQLMRNLLNKEKNGLISINNQIKNMST